MARITPEDGRAALDDVTAALERSSTPERRAFATAVRWTLAILAQDHPGHTVEVRVPPFAAVQAVPGPRHTRGTPPNVVETDPETWILLATGRLTWQHADEEGRIRASGTRADLSDVLPVIRK